MTDSLIRAKKITMYNIYTTKMNRIKGRIILPVLLNGRVSINFTMFTILSQKAAVKITLYI